MGSLVAGCRRWVPAGRAGGEREAFRERQPGDGEEPLGMKVSIRRPEPSTAAEEQPGGCVWRATKERVLGLQLAGRGDISQGEVSEEGLEGQGWGFPLPLGPGTLRAGSQPGALVLRPGMGLGARRGPGGRISVTTLNMLGTETPSSSSPQRGKNADKKRKKKKKANREEASKGRNPSWRALPVPG